MNQSKTLFRTRDLTISAMFCALTAVLSQVIIPLEPVPFSFGLMGVLLTSAILDTKSAFAAQLSYLLLGAVGIPVFSSFGSGPQKLIGPTGGYLFSYALISLVCGLLFQHVFRRRSFIETAFVLIIGVAICHLCGSLWLSYLMDLSFMQALGIGSLPFLAFDLLKAVFSAMVSVRVRRSLLQYSLIADGLDQ